MTDPLTRLNTALEGRYHIESELGEGGMATVYLADDLKHERKVALKVLKPELAAVLGAERFLAEIKTTANLQHPHILGLHDSGEADGMLFYVMPYVEGESLRERLSREHQLPVDDAVRIATNVAEALDYAHRQGVIHRDIKPANILLQDGKPVISDFGIALAVSAGGGGRLTETGLSLGTPHYMSPEQATGDTHVGPPTDIYALGCVLYEMLIGDPPYGGSTPQAILGKIIAGDAPAAKSERASVPANVDSVIARALETTPADRFSTAGSFATALGDSSFSYGLALPGPVAGPSRFLPYALTLTVVLLAAFAVWSQTRPTMTPQVVRTPMTGIALDQRVWGDMEMGEQGFVYEAERPDGTREYRYRRWSETLSRPVDGAVSASSSTMISPDGEYLAQAVEGELRVIPLGGGPVRVVANDSVAGSVRWGTDGYFYVRGFDGELYRLPIDGSEGLEPLGVPLLDGEDQIGGFQVAPNGRRGIFVANGTPSTINAFDLATGERHRLVDGLEGRLTPSGHLVYISLDAQVMAAAIDLNTLEIRSAPVPVEEGRVAMMRAASSTFRLGSNGTATYWRGAKEDSDLVWVDRDGRAQPVDPDAPLFALGAGLHMVALSPNDSLAVTRFETDTGMDLWLIDLQGAQRPIKLTSGRGEERSASFSADGTWVYYLAAEVGGQRDVWRIATDGSRDPELVYDHPSGSLSRVVLDPGGTRLVVRTDPSGGFGIDIFDIDLGTMEAHPIAADPDFGEREPALSPDGSLLAYVSNETGAQEVWVTPYPDSGAGKVRISERGGRYPVWSRNGGELLYRSGGAYIAARIEARPQPRVISREPLFTVGDEISGVGSHFAVARDGRILAARLVIPEQIIVVQNFFEELKRLVPN